MIRPATKADHATYARLLPEIVDDAIFDEARFAREMAPTTVVADELGYAYFVLIGDTAHVSQIAVAREARRRGLGKALLLAVKERARAAGCATWRLNVRPNNHAAIALYESVGLARAFESVALRVEWSAVPKGDVTGRLVAPEEDARIEASLGLLRGQLEQARAVGRLAIAVERDGELAAAVFDPSFPGASVFRASPGLAIPLLQALRPHADARFDFVGLKVEDQAETADALVASCARVRFRMTHMAAPLTT